MNFGTNLQNLRKKHDLSQEQLAEKLEVSRQAVSKWENGSSYPEMDKLIMLSELFNIDIDMLIKGNLDIENNEEGRELYEKMYNKFTKMITLGVVLILLGVTFVASFEETYANNIKAFPVIVLLTLIAISVFLFVYYGISWGNFTEEHPYFEDFYTKDEKRRFNKLFAGMISFGVFLILLGIIVVVIGEEVLQLGEDYPPIITVFLLLVTIAVGIFVYFGMQKAKYNISEYNKEYNKENESYELSKKEIFSDKIQAIIMLIATIIFLLIGFIFGLWHPGWVVFPIGGILCGIVSIIFDEK
ncbi:MULTISPECIES: helix-turn-helix domain-containing protein [Anaerofustis]|uniref:helix-turn-helix domain-containing protein n=1 Tax=Anaerofustis TaxID=264995 RepID=UPI0011065C15|nr:MULTISPECIES: helix-turn-helix transcriptional regulator [Anaerofustis]MCO8193890.1 helix-turn-helix domain-containing protein [Anaerofustis sp. NSJ-163]